MGITAVTGMMAVTVGAGAGAGVGRDSKKPTGPATSAPASSHTAGRRGHCARRGGNARAGTGRVPSLAAADCRDAAALEALNAAFLAE